jgi:hypothetical protein
MVIIMDTIYNEIRTKLAQAFLDRLNGEPTTNDLNAIRQFLKDNNVVSPKKIEVDEATKVMDELALKLPFQQAAKK